MVKVINSSGKHKTATARATVMKGTGKVRINKIPLELYTPELAMMKISEPLLIAGRMLFPDSTSMLMCAAAESLGRLMQ